MKAAAKPPTDELLGRALVAFDFLAEEVDRRVTLKSFVKSAIERPPHVTSLLAGVLEEAIAEYLRRFPKARCVHPGHVQSHNGIEWNVVCLFCRLDLATFGTSRNIGEEPWARIHAHTLLCGVLMLLGRLAPVGPGMERGERERPVAALTGNALIKAARASAEYLGRPPVTARYSVKARAGIAGGKASELRKLVSEARRTMKDRAKQTV